MTETRSGSTAVPEVAPKPVPAAGGRGARGGPGARISRYYREVVAELRKVVWPGRGELITYTVVVLFFVSVMIAIIGAFDYVFTRGVLAVFG